MTDARAFVAGATGYTGREVVAELCRRGIPTVAHVRPDSSALERWGERFGALGAEVDSTPWQDEPIAATLATHAPTLVFALLGTTRARMNALEERGWERSAASYEAIDYGLSAMLLRGCAALEPRPRYVYLSAAGVGGADSTAYYAARARLEQELRDGDVPFTIARPGIITGTDRDEDRPLERLAGMLVDGGLFVAGTFGARRLQDRYRSTTGGELGRALVRLALDPRAEGGVFGSEDLRDGGGA